MTKKIQEISLEELLDKKNLTNKEFSVKLEKRRDHEEGFILFYKAESLSTIYVGEQREHNYGGIRKGIEFDEDLLPYYKVEFKRREYRSYERILLSNTSMASSMAGLHQEIIREILKKKAPKAQQLYQKFKEDITEIINNAEEILEAYKQAYYLNDKSALKDYTKIQRRLFEATAENGTYVYDEDKEKERLTPKQYSSTINLKRKCINHGYKTKEEQAFSIWLYDYCMSRGYEKKIKGQDKEDEKALLSYLGELKTRLKEKGFGEVKR